MTPFQRQVFEAHETKKAEAKQEQYQQSQNGGGGDSGQIRNSRNTPSGGSSGMGQEETVRYINENDNSSDITFVD